MAIDVHAATGKDWEVFRTLRLNSLRQSPDSYRRVYEDEVEAPPDRWAPFLEKQADDGNADILLATVDGVAVGMAFVGLDKETSVMSIGGMWVEPAGRRVGVGRELVDRALDWGVPRAATRARLAVSIGNLAAERLYESCGFESTGEIEPLREESAVRVMWMERAL